MKTPKEKSTNHQVKYFKQRIYANPRIARQVLNSLKDDFPITTIKKVLRELETHPLVKKYFYGNPFPSELKDLGDTFYTYNSEIEKELEFLSLALDKFSTKISTFLPLKNLFEKRFILGEYQLANDTLNEIKDKFGFSLWLIENKLLVEEYTGGLKGNKEYLTYINRNNTDPFLTTIAYFLSIRAEKKISALNYKNKFSTLVADLNIKIKDYLIAKLNFLENEYEVSQFSKIVSYDSTFSMIDRYLSFLQICQIMVTSSKWMDKKALLKNILSGLNKKIADSRITHMLIVLGDKDQKVLNELNEKVLLAFEAYTIGNYQDSFYQAKELLYQNPTEFSLYELYIRSLFYMKSPMVKIGDKPESFLNSILENLYHVYAKKKQTKPSILNMQKIIKQIEGFSIGIQMYTTLKSLLNNDWPNETKRLNFINSSIHNPIHFNICPALNKYETLNVVKFFKQYNSITSKSEIETLSFTDIPQSRIYLYKAKKLIELGEYELVISFIENIINDDSVPIHLYEECITILFECHYKTNNIDKCIDVYVENYLINPNLITRINYIDIPIKIKSTKFKTAYPSINLPIFFKITNQDNHLINIASRLFLKAKNCERPQEIVKHKDSIDAAALIYFLDYVCTPEVIKYFIHLNSTKEILFERAMIYLQLIKLDTSKKENYWEEVYQITQNLAILDGIQQIDEGKIFVDEKNLIANELNETKANFARYIEISNLATEVPLLFIDLINNKKILVNISLDKMAEGDAEKSKLAENLKFELFKELFNEIKNAFLFSNKYGLESYLSTRIRHGTLLGQIRSQFQEQRLITKKNKENDKYYENEYWESKLNYLEPHLMNSLQFTFSEFSGKIDQLIRKITNDLIQIKTGNKNPIGLFDYTFPNQDLLILFKLKFDKINDYDKFLEDIFKELWKQTEICLDIIRAHFVSTIKEEFNKYLDTLYTDIKSLSVETKEFQEIYNNIISCKTNINNEVDTIANWFHLRHTSIDNFTIDKVINTSLEITNKISQGIRIAPVTKDIQSQTSIQGKFFIHFFDLIRIFFENIVNYSELSSEALRVSIYAIEDAEKLNVTIVNNLNDTINKEKLRFTLNSRAIELNNINWNMELTKRETGGTGFYKAKKILLFDLLNEDNTFNFELDENNEVKITIQVDLNPIRYEEDPIDRR